MELSRWGAFNAPKCAYHKRVKQKQFDGIPEHTTEVSPYSLLTGISDRSLRSRLRIVMMCVCERCSE